VLFVRPVRDAPFNRQALNALVAGWHRRGGHSPTGIPDPRPTPHLRHPLRRRRRLPPRGPTPPRPRRPRHHPGLSQGRRSGLEEAALSNPARALLTPRPSDRAVDRGGRWRSRVLKPVRSPTVSLSAGTPRRTTTRHDQRV
jgi:hypothetical protein